MHKVFRICLQSVVFAVLHHHVAQGISLNAYILFSTGILGLMNGWHNEKTSNLWTATAFHSHINSSITTRVCLFGT